MHVIPLQKSLTWMCSALTVLYEQKRQRRVWVPHTALSMLSVASLGGLFWVSK